MEGVQTTPTSPPPATPTTSTEIAATPVEVSPQSLLGDGTSLPAEIEGGDAGAAPEPVTPLTLADITVPEGVEVDETTIGTALEIMNNADLSSKDRLQKLVDLQASVSQAALKTQVDTWTEMQATWMKEAEALPDIGGKALPQTLASIKQGLTAVGADKAFYDALNLTGAGNNPQIIKVLHALTKPFTEGKPVSGAPPKGPVSAERTMYPSMNKE